MMNCVFNPKTLILRYIMMIYNIRAREIAKAVHLSDTMVKKHIDGDSYSEIVDVYIINKIFGLNVEGQTNVFN